MALVRHANRQRLFAAAQARALALNRPLVVVGDPNGGVWSRVFPAYGCGDVCVDLHGCPACARQLRADLTQRVNLADDSGVVFVSCVFEYIEDLPAAWAEVMRIAGTAENVFVVKVQPGTLSSILVPGAKWTIVSAPPEGASLQAVRVNGVFAGEGRLAGVQSAVLR